MLLTGGVTLPLGGLVLMLTTVEVMPEIHITPVPDWAVLSER